MRPELPESPLPQDPAYWDELAQRINEDAAEPLAAYAGGAVETVVDWYDVLARRALWLVAASAAAVLILWLTLPPRNPVAIELVERSLAPDDVAGSLFAGAAPPSLDAVMVQYAPEGREEEQG